MVGKRFSVRRRALACKRRTSHGHTRSLTEDVPPILEVRVAEDRVAADSTPCSNVGGNGMGFGKPLVRASVA
jgi:hypothetical protein